MFTNIGKKIKALAMVLCWIGIIGSLIASIAFFAQAGKMDEKLKKSGRSYYSDPAVNESTVASLNTTAWIFLIAGPLGSWISSVALYGFGELIDRTTAIDEKLNVQLMNAGGTPAQPGNPEAPDQAPSQVPEDSAPPETAGSALTENPPHDAEW